MANDAFVLASIVEGHGEVGALPVLLRCLRPNWRVLRPFRVNRYKIVKEGKLERYAEIATRALSEIGSRGGVLVELDAEEDLARSLAPELLARLDRSIAHVPHQVVLAVKSFEAWLVGGGAVTGLEGEPHPESIASPKRRIREVLTRYSESVDQPAIASRVDPHRASERCPSFAKLLRCLDALEAS